MGYLWNATIILRIKILVNKCLCLLYIEHSIQIYKATEDKRDGVPSLEALWSKVGNWVSECNGKKTVKRFVD